MDLLALRYFQEVARTEHISRAAERLRVAQPSLSRTIARLESELGVQLFDRQGRQVRLNRFGAAFARRVTSALTELDDARRELDDLAGLERGSLAIASETVLTLTDVVAAYLERHPDVEIKLFQSTPDAMRRQLHDREIDLGLASQSMQDPAFAGVDVVREQVWLALPHVHPLAGRHTVSLETIADEPFITTRPGHWQRELLDRLFAKAGRKPVIRCEGDEPGATQYMISVGLGIGLIPSFGRQANIDDLVAWSRLEDPDCHRTLRMVWLSDAYQSTAARDFRDFAAAWLRDLLETHADHLSELGY